jgi:hypothetical protein
MVVGGQRHAPAALPPGKTRYPLYRRLGGPQGRSRRVQKILPPPGFDPRTVRPVASLYTDCAIPAHTQRWQDKHIFHVDKQLYTNIPELQQPLQNSGCQTGDTKQVPRWLPTHISRHYKNFAARATSPPGFVHPWQYI